MRLAIRHVRWPVPRWTDVGIAAAFVTLVAAEALFSSGVRSPVLHMVVAGVAMAALAWRRHFPLGVAAMVIAANVAVNPEGQFSTLLSLVLVAFSIGSETSPPRSYVGLALLLVPFLWGMAGHGL